MIAPVKTIGIEVEDSAAPVSRFTAGVPGHRLSDIIRAECLGRNQTLLHIQCGQLEGLIFIESGDIVAAQAGRLLGEEALEFMLAAPGGAYQRVPWRHAPAQPMSRSWQQMVADAERAAAAARRTRIEDTERMRAALAPVRPAMDKPEPFGRVALAGGKTSAMSSEPGPDVQLDAQGNIVSLRNGDEDWAGIVAYAARLGEIIGDLMGLEGFRGLDCQFKNGRWLLARAPDGLVRASKIRNPAEAERTRATFGL